MLSAIPLQMIQMVVNFSYKKKEKNYVSDDRH